MRLAVGSLVWEKWRSDWYMGQVIEVQDDATQADGETSEANATDARRVKIHIHGEPETRDKWYDLPSENLVELVQIQAAQTAVGVFPLAGDRVELLVVDAPLASRGGAGVLLAGTVERVYPGRDASMVEVNYPADYALGGKRRVCVGNGYVGVPSSLVDHFTSGKNR